ncbi:MAG: ROK family glucokinase [Lachnospiraceae bacterium]|nr:ROK family glucokinase [Lachnospiraceae bacterium]
MKYCFGVDLGGTTVKMGVFTEHGQAIDKWEIRTRTENEGKYILSDIASSVLRKIAEHKLMRENIVGVGIGIPAPVTADGKIPGAVNLGWGPREIKKELEELVGLKVAVGNDADMAALGEMWLGGGKGAQNMMMITLGTGVGGGIIEAGKPVTGGHGGGGEIGHITVNYDEKEVCGCGRKGCLEMYTSATGIVRLAKRRLYKDNTHTILRYFKNLSAKKVFDAVKKGDMVATEIAQEFGIILGRALANIAATCDPSVFVIGGGVSNAGEILLDFIRKPFVTNAYYVNADTEFALAELGNDAGICGAAKLILGK